MKYTLNVSLDKLRKYMNEQVGEDWKLLEHPDCFVYEYKEKDDVGQSIKVVLPKEGEDERKSRSVVDLLSILYDKDEIDIVHDINDSHEYKKHIVVKSDDWYRGANIYVEKKETFINFFLKDAGVNRFYFYHETFEDSLLILASFLEGFEIIKDYFNRDMEDIHPKIEVIHLGNDIYLRKEINNDVIGTKRYIEMDFTIFDHNSSINFFFSRPILKDDSFKTYQPVNAICNGIKELLKEIGS